MRFVAWMLGGALVVSAAAIVVLALVLADVGERLEEVERDIARLEAEAAQGDQPDLALAALRGQFSRFAECTNDRLAGGLYGELDDDGEVWVYAGRDC